MTQSVLEILTTTHLCFLAGMSLQAIKLCFEYLPRSYKYGKDDPIAREKMHNAATIAGMAFANAFLGVCHSMAHKLGGTHHVPHGLANAMLINHVIRYNATDKPFKQTCFPQYEVPDALHRYAEVADALALGGNNKEEKVWCGIGFLPLALGLVLFCGLQ